ncbi:MAG: hypothetical protein ACTSYI_06835 [Promethearchaeota archaeon]
MKNQDLEFLWILSPQGDIYLQRVFDRSLATFDEDLFSSLLSTLSSFSTSVMISSFEELRFGDKIIFTKGYPEFQVILSARKTLKSKNISHLLEETGEAFRIEYLDYINSHTEIDITKFDKFGGIIDLIFGIESYVFLEEQDALLTLLDDAISRAYSEQYTVKVIIDFLDDLTDYKVDILINNIGENLKIILENTTGLSELQKKRYSLLLH